MSDGGPVVRFLNRALSGKLPPVPEKVVLRACVAYLATRGDVVWWRSNNAGVRVGDGATRYAFHGRKGVPDIICILRGGRFLGVECKSATGKQSPEQKAFQAEIERVGGLYLLVRSAEALHSFLEDQK